MIYSTAPEDFQLSNNMLTFVDGTSELQQCIDLMVVDDNLVEQSEFFFIDGHSKLWLYSCPSLYNFKY
jgi:hypothetical protein